MIIVMMIMDWRNGNMNPENEAKFGWDQEDVVV